MNWAERTYHLNAVNGKTRQRQTSHNGDPHAPDRLVNPVPFATVEGNRPQRNRDKAQNQVKLYVGRRFKERLQVHIKLDFWIGLWLDTSDRTHGSRHLESRETRENYVPDSQLQSALRKTLAHVGHPVTVISLLGTTVATTLAAPFQTSEFLRPVPLVLFWGLIITWTYTQGFFIGELLEKRLRTSFSSVYVALAILSTITGLAAAFFVMIINLLTFQGLPNGWGFAKLSITIFLLASVISFIIHILFEQANAASHAAKLQAMSQDTLPPLFDRIPHEKRGVLVSLSVEDHYVRVRTTQGEAMVLMRLSDAIRETTSVEGMQVHRSHWIAVEQVEKAERRGERAFLTLTHGPEIPVSRSYISSIRSAGLLP